MGYFLSFYKLGDWLEWVTFLSLIVGVTYFPITGKNYPQSYLVDN